MKILRPLLGRLTQGSIFSCASAEGYAGCEVYGFVITARCDVEQDKFPILNYVPIVKLDDWLDREGFDILSSRLRADLEGAISALLSQCKIAINILESQSLRDIESAFFSEPYTSKEIKSAKDRFSGLIARNELIDQIELNRLNQSGKLYEINDKSASALLKELIQHKITGYYFLPSVYDQGDDAGYVINLREVRHLTRVAAQKLANGLEASDGADIAAENGLSFELDTLAMPIGELSSPAVEHVLQTFSTLFGRIGLDDPSREYVDQICARRPKPEDQR
jgi:hypothetical protein